VTSRNVSLVHQYLEAVSSFAPFETVRAFFASDILIEEHPNLIAPRGRIRRAADLPAAYELGCQILKSQSYRVKHIIEAGDELAVQLEWTGILAVPVMNLPAESEMKAFVAMFLTSAKAKSPFSEITTVTRLSIRHPHPHKAPLSRSLLPFRAFHHLSNGQRPALATGRRQFPGSFQSCKTTPATATTSPLQPLPSPCPRDPSVSTAPAASTGPVRRQPHVVPFRSDPEPPR
jgi:hypothetical protein